MLLCGNHCRIFYLADRMAYLPPGIILSFFSIDLAFFYEMNFFKKPTILLTTLTYPIRTRYLRFILSRLCSSMTSLTTDSIKCLLILTFIFTCYPL